MLGDYTGRLAEAQVSAQTRRTYASKARQFLVWLDSYAATGDPLGERRARDWAVRDHRTHLLAVAKREPATNHRSVVSTPLTLASMLHCRLDKADVRSLVP